MNDPTITRTTCVGLTVDVEAIMPETPLTGLVLTREGVLTICCGAAGLAVQLDAEALAWLSRVADAYATGMRLQAAADGRGAYSAGQAVGHA